MGVLQVCPFLGFQAPFANSCNYFCCVPVDHREIFYVLPLLLSKFNAIFSNKCYYCVFNTYPAFFFVDSSDLKLFFVFLKENFKWINNKHFCHSVAIIFYFTFLQWIVFPNTFQIYHCISIHIFNDRSPCVNHFIFQLRNKHLKFNYSRKNVLLRYIDDRKLCTTSDQ